jgi:hypothetical protein
LKGTWLLLTAVAAVEIGAGAWAYDLHYRAVRWPARIQKETVGRVLATRNELLTQEDSFAWGEGFARWRYRFDLPSSRVGESCGSVDPKQCSFSRSRLVEEGVRVIVSYDDGILIVEEW